MLLARRNRDGLGWKRGDAERKTGSEQESRLLFFSPPGGGGTRDVSRLLFLRERERLKRGGRRRCEIMGWGAWSSWWDGGDGNGDASEGVLGQIYEAAERVWGWDEGGGMYTELASVAFFVLQSWKVGGGWVKH